MGCPNCNKESVISLSICPSCGTMVNDSVREELATRITPIKSRSARAENDAPSETKKTNDTPPSSKSFDLASPPKQIKLKPSPKKIDTKPKQTSEIVISETNRTLVEFQAQQSQLPEWRLQLKNVVQQRHGPTSTRNAGIQAAQGTATAMAPATAKGYAEQNPTAEPVPAGENQLLSNALKRIERSRSKYLIEDKPLRATPAVKPPQTNRKPSKSHPFAIAPRPDRPVAKPVATPVQQPVNYFGTKPKLVPEAEPESDKPITPKARRTAKVRRTAYDTNELDPGFIDAEIKTSFGTQPADKTEDKKLKKKTSESREIPEPAPEIDETNEDFEEFDEIVPFALRFNSGLFDLIIGSFASLLLLAPFMLLGGNWFTVAGFFGFLATFAVVMFIYMTTTIGLFGKTFGMHLFSLELIDIGGETYPSLHQAAVSSAVFLLSVALGGLGFVTSIFDEESRAVHDLASGTIVVKEL